MVTDARLIEVAREVAADLLRWYRAFSGLTGYAVDMGHAAEQLEDAILREEGPDSAIELARARILRLETAILDFLDHPEADGAIGRLGMALRQDFEEAVRLG